jgi:hypothetical protein
MTSAQIEESITLLQDKGVQLLIFKSYAFQSSVLNETWSSLVNSYDMNLAPAATLLAETKRRFQAISFLEAVLPTTSNLDEVCYITIVPYLCPFNSDCFGQF